MKHVIWKNNKNVGCIDISCSAANELNRIGIGVYIEAKADGKDVKQPENGTVPRMRTLNEIVNYFKSQDPNTAIKINYIRNLVLDGKVNFVQVGKKRYVDLDSTIEYIKYSNCVNSQKDDNKKCGVVRRIEEE